MNERQAGDAYGYSINHRPDLWQTVVNRHPYSGDFPPERRGIPVRVRIVWERDGEEWLNGRATRWTDDSVFVEFFDVRLVALGEWLAPSDVRRR